MKLLNIRLRYSGIRPHFNPARLVLVVVLVASVTSGLVMPGQACGIISHHHIAEKASDYIHAPGYADLLALLREYPGIVTYGALFPDSPGLGNYKEFVHSMDFVAAYTDYFKPVFRSSNPEDRKAIAFLLGVIAHNEADNAFHFGPNAFLWVAMQHEGQSDQTLFEEDIDLYIRDAYEGWGPWGHYCNNWENPTRAKEATLSILNTFYPGHDVTDGSLSGGFSTINAACVWESVEPRDVHSWMEANFMYWPDGGLLDMFNHIAAVWMQTWDGLSETSYSLYLPAIVR